MNAQPHLILAGNETAAEELAGNAANGEAVFTLEQPDSFFIPYGSYPHKVGLQVFQREDAEAMVANHGSFLERFKRAVGMESYPVYIGHPDLPGSKDADKRAYGWIDTLAAENDGLRLGVKWSEAGRELVENAHFRFYSPLWFLAKGKGGLRPRRMKSMGLTNDPNIPVPALANETDRGDAEAAEVDAETFENNEADEIMIKKLMAALGLEEGANEEAALAAITELKAKAAKLEEKPAEEEAEAEPEPSKPAEASAPPEDAKPTVPFAKAAEDEESGAPEEKEKPAENEGRGAVIELALEVAANSGRILPVEVAAKRDELLAANDLPAAIAALGKLPVKLKTTSRTGDLGGAKVTLVTAANDEGKARREERTVAVANEYDRTNAALPEGERKRIAWSRAQAKNPDLFKNQSPGTAA
jgi:hypothetical protein